MCYVVCVNYFFCIKMKVISSLSSLDGALRVVIDVNFYDISLAINIMVEFVLQCLWFA